MQSLNSENNKGDKKEELSKKIKHLKNSNFSRFFNTNKRKTL